MAKLSTFVIGFIIVAATSLVLINIIGELTLSYGVTAAELMNTTGVPGGGLCSASNTVARLRELSSMFQNESVDSGTYAPGQINAPIGSNMVTSTQSSGLVTTLKTAVAPLTLTKAMITDVGCSLGVPSELILAFQICFAISILLLIAGIFYFRPI